LIAGGGAGPADAHEMALQFLATWAAALDLPEKLNRPRMQASA
jgi:hypothetical protein